MTIVLKSGTNVGKVVFYPWTMDIQWNVYRSFQQVEFVSLQVSKLTTRSDSSIENNSALIYNALNTLMCWETKHMKKGNMNRNVIDKEQHGRVVRDWSSGVHGSSWCCSQLS